jgi:hypothetical protein
MSVAMKSTCSARMMSTAITKIKHQTRMEVKMMDNPVSEGTARFADLVQDLPDAALEKDWGWGSYESEGVRFAYFRTYEDLRQLAVQLAHVRERGGNSPSEAQRILAQYHSAFQDLQAVLLGMESRHFDLPPAEDEWPVRRTVAHILGADMGFFVVTRFSLERYREREDPFAEIDDETWLGIIGLDGEELDTLMEGPLPGLNAFHMDLHQRILADFEGITDQELEKMVRYWEDEHYSLRFRLHRFDAHMRQHTIQIEKTLQTLGYVPGESLRLLRLIYAALAQVEGALIGCGPDCHGLLHEAALHIDARTDEIAAVLSG